jgi:hypothetical protein
MSLFSAPRSFELFSIRAWSLSAVSDALREAIAAAVSWRRISEGSTVLHAAILSVSAMVQSCAGIGDLYSSRLCQILLRS